MRPSSNVASTMDDNQNLKIYKTWSPVYDLVMGPFYGKARQKTLSKLDLKPGEKVLITGVGTGLDLPLIPAGVSVTGIDLSAAMLKKAHAKFQGSNIELKVMNAQKLEFKDNLFDAVILNLILSVVPDGNAAFREAWRVLRGGGRAVIFDKFLPEAGRVTLLRRLIGGLLRAIGTDPNRRLKDIISGVTGMVLERDEPSLLKGQYRILLLKKKENPR